MPDPAIPENNVTYFDRNLAPIQFKEWERLTDDSCYYRVASTVILSRADPTVICRVSTIWTGSNTNAVPGGPPLVFETMAFGVTTIDLLSGRHPSEAAALRGHEEMVAVAAAAVDGPVLVPVAGDAWEAAARAAAEEELADAAMTKLRELLEPIATSGDLEVGMIEGGWRIKRSGAHYVDVMRAAYGYRVVTTPTNCPMVYDRHWLYAGTDSHGFTAAVVAAAMWDGAGDTEPEGWNKNGQTDEWREPT